MAIYRQVHISFWQDEFVLNLTPEEKFFYLYLMTNSKTTQCGIYELPIKVIEFETGYNNETVIKLLTRFIEYGKIKYCESTKEIMLLNWMKHNSNTSPKVISRVKKELNDVKNADYKDFFYKVCIQYRYPIDTEPQEEPKPKPKEESKDNKDLYVEIINYLNKKTGKKFSPKTKDTQEKINGRLSDGYTLEDFKKVINNKCASWRGKKNNDGTSMEDYLRPSTLFAPSKFESYLNETDKPKGRVADF